MNNIKYDGRFYKMKEAINRANSQTVTDELEQKKGVLDKYLQIQIEKKMGVQNVVKKETVQVQSNHLQERRNSISLPMMSHELNPMD